MDWVELKTVALKLGKWNKENILGPSDFDLNSVPLPY